MDLNDLDLMTKSGITFRNRCDFEVVMTSGFNGLPELDHSLSLVHRLDIEQSITFNVVFLRCLSTESFHQHYFFIYSRMAVTSDTLITDYLYHALVSCFFRHF